METKQTSIPVDSIFTDSLKKKVIIFSMVAIVALFVVVNWYGQAQANREYKPLSPQSEQGWQEKRKALCEQEKVVAQANLMDVAHGITINKDLNTLPLKRDMVCDFQKAQQ